MFHLKTDSIYIGKIFIPMWQGLIWVSNQTLYLPSICPAIASFKGKNHVWPHHIWLCGGLEPSHEAGLSMGSHLSPWREEWATTVSRVRCAGFHRPAQGLMSPNCAAAAAEPWGGFLTTPDIKGKCSSLICRKKMILRCPCPLQRSNKLP